MAKRIRFGESKLRGWIFGILGFGLVFGLTQFVLPGQGGEGTPPAIIFNGLLRGLLDGLIAVGIVLIYRNARFINFAQASLGSVGGVFAYNFAVFNEWPTAVALIVGLMIAAATGLIVELGIIRRFFNAPRLVLTVFTIALIEVTAGGIGFISNLPIFPDPGDRTIDEIAGRASIRLPFEDFQFQIGDLPLAFGFRHLLAGGCAILAILGLAAFLKFSRMGIAIRAVAENPERATLLRINVGNVSMTVWAIAGFLSGLGVIMGSVATGQFALSAAPPETLLTALAAAIIARMHSITGAVLSAVGINILRMGLDFSFESEAPIVNVGLWVILLVALLLQGRRVERSEVSEESAWQAAEEYRPIPKEMTQVSSIRNWRWSLVVTGLLAVLIYGLIVPPRLANLGAEAAIMGIVMLSLVVLTGWAGQVSLGQFAFVAVGAVVGAALTSKMGISFWIALPLVPFITAAFAIIIGLPALRIRGLFLGVTTFAFAFAVQTGLFNPSWFAWLLSDRVDRPSLLLFDFEDERSMYYFSLLMLVLAIMVVLTLRRARPGRVLIALRENEANVQAFGVNLLKTRLAAFALAGFLCGFAGVLFAHHQRAVSDESFGAALSLQIFLFAVLGGVGSIAGAMMAAVYFAVWRVLEGSQPWGFLFGPIFILFILYMFPGGLSSLVFGLRDAVLRIVAQRRQMIVPSLFADVDAEALRRKLIPLADPIPSSGLAALAVDRRYRAASELYGPGGRLSAGWETVRSETDAAALGAAAEGLQETVQGPTGPPSPKGAVT